MLEPVPDFERIAGIALQHGFRVNTHRIGDRAHREVLDPYERAQHVQPYDAPRFAEHRVIAAVQGVHCTSDGPSVPTRLGRPGRRGPWSCARPLAAMAPSSPHRAPRS